MTTPLKKSDLVARLSEQAGCTKADAAALLDAFGEVTQAALANGEAVTLPGLGKLEARIRPARMIRNPATGEQMQKAADRAPKFVASKTLKDAINP
jgi:DNA-binding protein HU-beta